MINILRVAALLWKQSSFAENKKEFKKYNLMLIFLSVTFLFALLSAAAAHSAPVMVAVVLWYDDNSSHEGILLNEAMTLKKHKQILMEKKPPKHKTKAFRKRSNSHAWRSSIKTMMNFMWCDVYRLKSNPTHHHIRRSVLCYSCKSCNLLYTLSIYYLYFQI